MNEIEKKNTLKSKYKRIIKIGTLKNVLIFSSLYICLCLYSDYEFWINEQYTYSYIILWMSIIIMVASYLLYILTTINVIRNKEFTALKKVLKIMIIVIALVIITYIPQILSDSLFGEIILDG